MIPLRFLKQLGAILNMTDFSKNAKKIQKLMQGSEVERRLSASVIRTILSDMITLYFENRKARGPGILVFNPEDPLASKYVSKSDVESDLAIAEEAMESNLQEMFNQILRVIEKEDKNNQAMVALIEEDGMNIHLLDAEEANKRIDEAANGLIF